MTRFCLRFSISIAEAPDWVTVLWPLFVAAIANDLGSGGMQVGQGRFRGSFAVFSFLAPLMQDRIDGGVVLVVSCWVDRYVMVFPSTLGEAPTFGIWEAASICCLIGTTGLLFFRSFAAAPLVPPMVHFCLKVFIIMIMLDDHTREEFQGSRDNAQRTFQYLRSHPAETSGLTEQV